MCRERERDVCGIIIIDINNMFSIVIYKLHVDKKICK